MTRYRFQCLFLALSASSPGVLSFVSHQFAGNYRYTAHARESVYTRSRKPRLLSFMLQNNDIFSARRMGSIVNDSHNRSELENNILLYGTLLLSLLVISIPSLAFAVDHPVDHDHLGIPSPVPDVRYFISGGLCAAASHGVTTPLDVVKTRIQAEPENFNQGLLRSVQAIVEKDGIGSLLGGLGPTIVGYGLEGALKFGLYESFKPVFAALVSFDDPTLPYLGASVVAGAVASVVLCPMEKTRIRLVTDPTFASGLLSGLSRQIREDGFGGSFSGVPAMLSKQVPYTMTKQVSFDEIAAMLYTLAANANFAAAQVKYEVSVSAALIASILSCITSHPGDVILTDTYKKEGNAGFQQVVAEVYETQGLGGFFAGLTARFLHVGAIITSQLVLYDIVKQLLGLPATGAH